MDVIEHVAQPGGADGPAQPEAAGRLERWLHRPGTAWAILVGSLIATALAWQAARHFAIDEARQRFERRTDDIQTRIEGRMASYEAMLRGGVALFAAQPDLSRDAWQRYVRQVEPEKRYPGIQGVGVSRLLRPDEVAAHEDAVRAEGYPKYAVRPPGPRAAYTSIVYLEPLLARNLRAFGFDMMSEPTRREAMLRARDTGHAAVSGTVTLVQEDGKDVQKGFLLYLPVYKGGAVDPPRLWGWVYAAFRVRDLMTGILGNDLGHIAFRIHDGDAGVPGDAFFSSEAMTSPRRGSGFTLQRPVEVAGRRWTVVYEGKDFEAAAVAWQSNLVAACGLVIDFLLYLSILTMSRRKRQVEREVDVRTAEARSRMAWLTAVTGLSPDGVLVFERGPDDRHRLVFTNPALSRLFGLRPEDLLGLTEQAVAEWLAGLAHEGDEMPPLGPDSARLSLAGPPARVLKRGMREGERHRVYYFHDVTHESEVELLKNEFLSTAAHELRTPLASVYGFAELLQNENLDPARRRRAASIVYRQARVLKHLVDELLDLSRLDAGKGRDFVNVRIDLRQLAEGAAESLLKPEEMSRVHLALGAYPTWVDVDPTKLQQGIANLLSNALKYSRAPAPVSLTLTASPGNGHDGGWAVLRIVDAGIGMTPEQCARAFERFYRADPSGHILGAGLGLSIAKEVIDRQGGRIELRSMPGAGTQATLWLPLREAPEEPPPAVAEVADAAAQPA